MPSAARTPERLLAAERLHLPSPFPVSMQAAPSFFPPSLKYLIMTGFFETCILVEDRNKCATFQIKMSSIKNNRKSNSRGGLIYRVKI